MIAPLPLQEFMSILRSCWDVKTSFTPEEWTAANPARGQCLVSSLVVQDYYGGDLKRYRVKGNDFEETHYCNILYNGTVLLDTTAAQYTAPVLLATSDIELRGYATAREKYLSDHHTRAQYEILRERVKQARRQPAQQ